MDPLFWLFNRCRDPKLAGYLMQFYINLFLSLLSLHLSPSTLTFWRLIFYIDAYCSMITFRLIIGMKFLIGI
jgi:hypothetical protein